MKRRSVVMWLTVALAAFLCLCPATWRPPSKPTVRAVNLLLDISAFPPGWVVRGPYTPESDPEWFRDEDAYDYASIEFAPQGKDPGDMGAFHQIWNFGNGRWAAIQFYTRFRPEKPPIPTPPSLCGRSYRSAVADRFRLFCWRKIGCPDCTVIAQYGEFISALNISLSCEDRTPVADLESILKAIDERMAQDLHKLSSQSATRTLLLPDE